LLQRAFDADLTAARRALDAANKRFLTAAKTKADLAELKLTELQFTTAVEDFRVGATNRSSEAEPLYRRALVIDEKSYGPDRGYRGPVP
jgi:hypothetical protein